jgi:phosphate ABC transporter phosphate-binding protein
MRRTSSVLTTSFLGVASVGLAVVLLVGGCSGGKQSGNRLKGAGSSFVAPAMEDWTREFESKGVSVDYASVGSGNGISNMIGKKVDFGCTDAPLNKKQLEEAEKEGGDVVHVPLVMGAVVIIYNLDLDKPIKFDGPTLADIYQGNIKRWNHDRLKKLNPEIKNDLPDLPISVVHRSDSSGTSYIFTDYLSSVSPEWKEKVGMGTSPTWPVGQGEPKNPGVANAVKGKKGAIGYVELIYALQNKGELKYGRVQNQEKEFPEPTIESVTAAAAGKLKDIPDDLRFSIVNAPGKGAYPISGTVWAVAYVKQPSEKVNPLKDFLRWLLHEGQPMAEKKHYASLPKGLVERAEKKIEQIKAE